MVITPDITTNINDINIPIKSSFINNIYIAKDNIIITVIINNVLFFVAKSSFVKNAIYIFSIYFFSI